MKRRHKHIILGVLVVIAALMLVVVFHGKRPVQQDFLAEIHALQQKYAKDGNNAPLPVGGESVDKKACLELDAEEIDLGLIPSDEPGSKTIEIRNTGLIPLNITGIKSSCACTKGEMFPDEAIIPPLGKGRMLVTVYPERITGFKSSKILTVFSNDPVRSMLELTVNAQVEPEFEISPEKLDFGAFDKGQTPALTLRLIQLQEMPFKVVRLLMVGESSEQEVKEGDSDFILNFSEVDEPKRRVPGKAEFEVTVAIAPDIAPGKFSRQLRIVTDIQRKVYYPVSVKGTVTAPYTIEGADRSKLFLKKSGITPGLQGQIAVISEAPVQIAALDENHTQLTLNALSGDEQKKWTIQVTAGENYPKGEIKETIRFSVRAGEQVYQERLLIQGAQL